MTIKRAKDAPVRESVPLDEAISDMDETFSVHPATLLAQSEATARMELQCGDFVQIFARDTRRHGLTTGTEIVAYDCDQYGVVANWSQRYHSWDEKFDRGILKLRLAIINGLIDLERCDDVT